MSHPEPEILLRSVGGSTDEETRRHLETCARCRSDLATLTRARSAGATLAADPGFGTLEPPPHAVWQAIRHELGEAPEPSPVTSVPEPSPRPRSRRTWMIAAASVAAGAILGALVTTWVARDGDGAAQPAARTAALNPLGDHVTSGTLALGGPPTRESLSVVLHESDPGEGFLEVWLLDARTGGMVALGVLDGDRGSYAVPPGLDLTTYDQVDVSREPYDGDPAHSQQSLARGRVP